MARHINVCLRCVSHMVYIYHFASLKQYNLWIIKLVSSWVHTFFFVGSVLLIFLVFCVVFYLAFLFCLSSSCVFGNIGHKRHRTKTIQRHWQHWAHKTQDEDNSEKLATLGTQDTGGTYQYFRM
jgi:hypothetical protein